MTEKRKIFKKEPVVSVILSNMRLVDIPTQTRRIYIKAKQGRFNSTAPSASIQDNTVTWSGSMTIHCRAPANPKKKEVLRLSFRLEPSNGNKYTRYGYITLDLASMKGNGKSSIDEKLSECQYKTKFTCDVVIEPFGLPKIPKAHRKKTSNESLSGQGELSHFKHEHQKQMNKSQSAGILNQSSSYKVTSEPDFDSDPCEEMKLTISVSKEKMNCLEQQVDEILGMVLRYRNLQ